jgi:hypothetical protein
MPTLYASNIKAAFILGIILAVLSLVDIILLVSSGTLYKNPKIFPWTLAGYGVSTFEIITGVLVIVSALILIYGAYTRNSKAMQIYMGSAILAIILMIVATVLMIKVFCVVNEFNNDMFKELKKACKDPSAQNHPSFSYYQGCLDFGMGLYKGNKETILGIFGILITVGVIIFDIWTVIVAKNAKKEMEEADNMILLE